MKSRCNQDYVRAADIAVAGNARWMIGDVEGPQISRKKTVILSEVEESGAPQGDNCRIQPRSFGFAQNDDWGAVLGSPDALVLTTNGNTTRRSPR